jgi:flagellar assembly protein FliH
MSSSKIAKFTEAELEALDTWTALENFGTPRSETVDTEEATQILTVEQIEAMQKQAYDEAFEHGRQEGFEQGKTEGFEEGKKQGFEEGSKLGYEENLHLLQKQASEFSRLMETLSEPLKKLDETVEAELVRLAIGIAGQIIRREIKHNPGEIIAVIREAIKVLPLASHNVTLNLHPEDAELVRSMLKLDDSLPPWRLVENPLISRGGCTVETEVSSIDATVENRLAAVVATVLGGERQQDTPR